MKISYVAINVSTLIKFSFTIRTCKSAIFATVVLEVFSDTVRMRVSFRTLRALILLVYDFFWIVSPFAIHSNWIFPIFGSRRIQFIAARNKFASVIIPTGVFCNYKKKNRFTLVSVIISHKSRRIRDSNNAKSQDCMRRKYWKRDRYRPRILNWWQLSLL